MHHKNMNEFILVFIEGLLEKTPFSSLELMKLWLSKNFMKKNDNFDCLEALQRVFYLNFLPHYVVEIKKTYFRLGPEMIKSFFRIHERSFIR